MKPCPAPSVDISSLSARIVAANVEEAARNRHPLKRFGRPAELANLAAYLISPQAGYINGECVVIDGGEWFRGAGEFNNFSDLPDGGWEALERRKSR